MIVSDLNLWSKGKLVLNRRVLDGYNRFSYFETPGAAFEPSRCCYLVRSWQIFLVQRVGSAWLKLLKREPTKLLNFLSVGWFLPALPQTAVQQLFYFEQLPSKVGCISLISLRTCSRTLLFMRKVGKKRSRRRGSNPRPSIFQTIVMQPQYLTLPSPPTKNYKSVKTWKIGHAGKFPHESCIVLKKAPMIVSQPGSCESPRSD